MNVIHFKLLIYVTGLIVVLVRLRKFVPWGGRYGTS